jgi:hypothetical protein
MDALTRGHWQNILSSDREVQGAAYSYLLEATARPVAWAYDVWDDLVGALTHKEGRTRSIAAQLLCNLARSDPERRVLRDFNALFAVTADPKYVTARHALQAMWRIGTVGKTHESRVIGALTRRFQRLQQGKELHPHSLRHRPVPPPALRHCARRRDPAAGATADRDRA